MHRILVIQCIAFWCIFHRILVHRDDCAPVLLLVHTVVDWAVHSVF